MQENRDTNRLVVMTLFPWWVGNLFIHHQWIPSQMWGHFLPGEKVLTSILKPVEWQFKGELQTNTASYCWTRPLGSWHFFSSPPRDPRKCNLYEGCWMDWWAHQRHDLSCANQHQKIVVLATLIQGLSGSRVVSYPVTYKQQKQTNLGCLGHPRALTAEQIKNTSLKGHNLTPREALR